MKDFVGLGRLGYKEARRKSTKVGMKWNENLANIEVVPEFFRVVTATTGGR